VSTVDSGNLAAHLLTLRVGLLELPDQPIVSRRVFEGLADTLGVLRESRGGEITELQAELRSELASALAESVTSLGDARRRLEAGTLAGNRDEVGGAHGRHDSDRETGLGPWLLDQCQAARAELFASRRGRAAAPLRVYTRERIPTLHLGLERC
jgi:hypothetical protein